MHASVRPALSVNIPQPTVTNTGARDSTAELAMRMAVSKVNFFYGTKQTLFDVNLSIATNELLVCRRRLTNSFFLKDRLSSSGNFAILTAILRASSRSNNFAADLRPGSSSK